MNATSRSTLPVFTRVIPRKAARPPALLLVLTLLMCLAALVAGAYAQPAQAAVTLDGAVSSGMLASGTTISVNHTIGANTDLMLVGVSANSYGSARTISSVTFTPSGGSATALTLVGQIENGAGRLVAIYELQRNPRSGATGAVTVTFSNSVGYGIVVGVANFTGVDTSSPLDGFASAVGTDASPTVTVANDADGRNELLFDTVFLGSAPQVGTLGVGAGQSQGWNLTYSTTTARLVGAGSTEEATGTSTIMSWAVTGGPASRFWAIGAVPINPAPVGTTYNLTMGVSPSDGGTTTPAVGVHAYPEGTPVDITATPNPGYEFDSWTGGVADPNSASTTVTMGADKTVTANFEPLEYTLTVNVVGEGTVSPDTGTYDYGEQVLLTATPAVGHVFAGWSGDLADGVNPQTVTMNSDKTVTATFEQYVPMLLGLDGAPSSGTGAANATSVSFSHTTGTGTDRLMLVGVSWNCGSADRTNPSVTFTPSLGSAINLTAVITQKAENLPDAQLRYSAIYKLLSPPKGVAGTVTVTFSDTVSNGIVAGAADFAGVDQSDPLGTAVGAGYGTNPSANKAPTVTLTGLHGNELVFDNVFMGGSDSGQWLTADAGQTERWNDFSSNTRAAASTKEASGSPSVTMSWTANANAYWAIAAVPINPVTIDVSVPASVVQGADLAVDWAPNLPVDLPAQFSVWLVRGGIWTQAGVFDANGEASYQRNVAADVPVGDGYQVYVYYRASSGAAWTVYGLAPGTVEVTAPPVVFHAIDVSVPASVVQGADLAVDWAPNLPVDLPAQFSVWLVRGGIWTQAGVFDANGEASYQRNVAADVPVGDGYQVYVYYRASSGAAWTVYGLAPGTVEVTAPPVVFHAIDVSVPASVVQGADLAVDWAPNLPVDLPAQFSVWLVRGGIWTQAGVFDANGEASYQRNVAADVPVGDGYQVYVYYRASSGAAWTVYGLAPGTVEVTAPPVVFHAIDVSVPASVVQGADLAVDWAPNLPVDLPAQFSVWLVRGGIWTQAGVFDANGEASYQRNVAADVPVGDGYQVYVYYRASSGAAWTVYGLAPGTVEVTNP